MNETKPQKTSIFRKFFQNGGSTYEVTKALIIAMLVTLAAVLLLALILKWAPIPDAVISVINQAVKMIALTTAALLSFRSGRGGWRKGLVTGVIYILVSFLLFSSIRGEISADITLLYDTLLGGAMGLCAGVLSVNLRRPKMAPCAEEPKKPCFSFLKMKKK